MGRRDPWLDNAKVMLVTLVVVGHSLTLPRSSELSNQAYDFVYYFHIPAFVLVTGYMSRSFTWSRRHLWSLFCTIVVPFLLFEPLLVAWRVQLGDDIGNRLWLQPHWAMWYLVAVFFWRLAAPVLKRSGWMVPASVVVSAAAGLHDFEYLSLNRVLGLLPFFVIGLHLGPKVLDRLRSTRAIPPAVVAMVLLWWWSGRTDDWARTPFLHWDTPYSDFTMFSTAESIRIRLVVMVIALAATAAMLALTPRGRQWFTAMGSATMVVYLGHTFVIRWVRSEEFFRRGEPHERLDVLAVVTFGIALSLLLASPGVRRVGAWAVDPIGSWQRHQRSRKESTHLKG